MVNLVTREFPPYKYAEYPKMVIPPASYWADQGHTDEMIGRKTLHDVNNPSYKVVESPEEELKVMGFLSQDKVKEDAAAAADTGELKFLHAILTNIGRPFPPDATVEELRAILEDASTGSKPAPEPQPAPEPTPVAQSPRIPVPVSTEPAQVLPEPEAATSESAEASAQPATQAESKVSAA